MKIGLFALACLLAGPVGAVLSLHTDLAALSAAAERSPRSAPIARGAMLQTRLKRDLELAPRGGVVAVLEQRGDQRSLALLTGDALEATPLLPKTNAESVQWSQDGRYLLLISDAEFSVLRIDGGEARRLLRRHGPHREALLGVDPGQDAAWLYLLQTAVDGATPAPRYQLRRLHADGQDEVLYDSAERIVDAVLDADGRPSWRWRVEGDAHVIEHLAADQAPREVLRCAALRRCTALQTRATADGLALFGNPKHDLRGLDILGADDALQRRHQDPKQRNDLDDVVLDRTSQQPRIALYRATAPQQIALDAESAAPLAALQGLLDGADLGLQIGAIDEAWLVAEHHSLLPQPRWYRFDPGTATLQRLFGGDATDDSSALPAQRHPVRWHASDGRALHGFLTLPSGVSLREAVVVVAVHGGPWSHEEFGYSALSQFLASRGVAVFEPNFRGSTGFGREFLLSAAGQFGSRVLDDIDQGLETLHAAGIGQHGKALILGASYGGYATLAGLTRRPDLYRAGVAMVPPSDFAWVIDWASQASDASLAAAVPLREHLDTLNLGAQHPDVMQDLRVQSPRQRVAELRQPVLILAGGRDERVPIRGVTDYVARLRASGKAHGFYLDSESGHGLEGRDNREIMYFLIEQTLHHFADSEAPADLPETLRHTLRQRMRSGAWPPVATAD